MCDFNKSMSMTMSMNSWLHATCPPVTVYLIIFFIPFFSLCLSAVFFFKVLFLISNVLSNERTI